jgi:hypothetical protein
MLSYCHLVYMQLNMIQHCQQIKTHSEKIIWNLFSLTVEHFVVWFWCKVFTALNITRQVYCHETIFIKFCTIGKKNQEKLHEAELVVVQQSATDL